MKRYVVSVLRCNTTYDTLEADVCPKAYKTIEEAKKLIEEMAETYYRSGYKEVDSPKQLLLVYEHDEADFVEFEYTEVEVEE